MDVDVKVITLYIWRFSVFFTGICFRFAQKHPCISGTLLSLFFLYVFFPLVFKLLIYSSPIMVWVYASRKNVVSSEHPEALIKNRDDLDQMNDGNSKWVKVDDNVLAKKRFVNFSVQNGRIDARVNYKASVDYDPELQHKVHSQGKNGLNKAISQSESDVLGKPKNDLMKTEDNLKKTEDMNTETAVDDTSKANEKSEAAISEKAFDQKKENQEDDAPGYEQKEVECTNQDEKNKMDFGTSETERDKRLDSLIQKRRARKLLSMQVRNVIDIMRHPQNQIAPLVIARSTGPLNLINTLSDTDDLHMPGSAPSVLLPTRSPFDLPYDPFEERPNLTEDSSFQQEFISGDQKDVFSGGPFGHGQDGNSLNAFMNKEKNGMTRHGFSRFRSYRERGSYESLSPGASSAEQELMTRDDITVHDSRYEEHSLNQPTNSDNVPLGNQAETENLKISVNFEESDEKFGPETINAGSCKEGCGIQVPVEGNSDNPVEGAKADSARDMSSEDLTSYLRKSLTSSLQEIATKEAKENGHEQPHGIISSKDLFNVHKRVLHTRAHSIASDLVVEVSDAGSPPPTLSPPDEDSSQYDGDVDKDISSGSEDMSMHVYRTEDISTRCLDGHQSGKDGLALEESIPEAVELEQDVLDGYEHTSQTSSDDVSSYENIVHHLNEKLKARHGGYAELSSPTSAESNAVTSEKHYEQETDLKTGTFDSQEHEGDSGHQDHRSVEESLLPIYGEGSPSMELSEKVQQGNAMRSSVSVALSDTQQALADEELPNEASPNSVLPDTDSRNIITMRPDTVVSDLALPNNLPDVLQPEDSIPRTFENQDLASLTSERGIEEAITKVTESEATMHSGASEDQNSEASVIQMSLDTKDDSLVQSVCDNIDESIGPAVRSLELNASSTSESSQINVVDDSSNSVEPSTAAESRVDASALLGQKSSSSTEPTVDAVSQDSELQIHHSSETSM